MASKPKDDPDPRSKLTVESIQPPGLWRDGRPRLRRSVLRDSPPRSRLRVAEKREAK